MDVFTDPNPVIYQLGWLRKFTLPDDAGGKTAIAVSNENARKILAVYTILIMGIFMVSWAMTLSLWLLLFTPKIMTRTRYIAVVAAWNANEPFQATILMAQHMLQILKGMWDQKYPVEFNTTTLLFDLGIFLIAAGTFGGSVALGILFPELLVIGSAAPVTADMMFYPSLLASVNGSVLPQLQKLEYSGMGAVRAFGAIEGSEVTIKNKIDVTTPDAKPSPGGEPRYSIKYGYNVTGAEMGLQHFGDLIVLVNGSCEFRDDWYVKVVNNYDEYRLWRGEDPASAPPQVNLTFGVPAASEIDATCSPYAIFYAEEGQASLATKYYTVIPSTAKKYSATESLDPWYNTNLRTRSTSPNDPSRDFNYEVRTGRPPLKCVQTDIWSYKGWKGSTAEMYKDGPNRAPFTLPVAIERIISTEFAVPMIVNIGRALQAGALKSSTRLLAGLAPGIDGGASKAEYDMKRVILAAFLSTRQIFRDAAMARLELGRQDGATQNILEENGKMLEGSGDVVIVSSAVSSLRFGYFIAVPSILAGLIFLNGLFKLSRKAVSRSCYDGTFNPGKYNRFLVFLMGLQATQLYRMVDQILAEVEVANDGDAADEVINTRTHDERMKEQAHWDRQLGVLPRVVLGPSTNDGRSIFKTPSELVLPQLRVVKVANAGAQDGHRLILRTRNGPDSKLTDGEWKKLQRQPPAPKPATVANPPANTATATSPQTPRGLNEASGDDENKNQGTTTVEYREEGNTPKSEHAPL